MTCRFARVSRIRSVARRAALAAVIPWCVVAACAKHRPDPVPAVSSLVVHNHSPFDVDVYAVPVPKVFPTRLGTVAGNANATYPLRAENFQSSGMLVVLAHVIGSERSWTSAPVAVGSQNVAVLDVVSDSSGDASRSTLQTAPASSGKAAGR